MISARGLFYSYTGQAPYVLNGIDFDMKKGEYVSIVGDNGSGKSTLVRLILKFIRPVRGELECRADKIGYVPQKSDSHSAGFPITVFELLNSYRKLLKVKDKREVSEKLKIAGLEPIASRLISTLSGGQLQKTLIARALIGNPDLIILDEPSTGVDSASQNDIYSILKSLNRENGITIVSVEHNLVAAISNSTQIYHLSSGAGHICTPAQYAKEYLNVPKNGGEFSDA